jgi:hypothetical protein
MNRYGAMAWEHWERHRPSDLSTIEDPVSCFRELGEFVNAEITAETNLRLSPTEATDPARVRQVRHDVEEEILATHVLPAAEPDPTAEPDEDHDLTEVIEIPLNSPALDRLRLSPLLQNPPTPT